MTKTRLFLFTVIFAATCPAFGQLANPFALPNAKSSQQPASAVHNTPAPAPAPIPVPLPGNMKKTTSSGLLLASASGEPDSGFNAVPPTAVPPNGVAFAAPEVAGERSNVTFPFVSTPPALPDRLAAPIPNAPVAPETLSPVQAMPPVYQPQEPQAPQPQQYQPRQLPQARPAATPAPVPAPALTARPVAQNAVTKTHRLRLAPQIFEKNLVERLGNRFVPVRNVAADAAVSQYRLPVRDGTAIELSILKQQGMVSVTGSPNMVDASLRIVQLLDTDEAANGPVARFVPVQQSNVDAARRVADIVNRESVRVAQTDRPAVVTGQLPQGLNPNDLAAAGVVGPVNIEILDAFGTVIIRGTPEDVAIIQGMLRQLEMLSLENEPVIELIPMRHADSLRISQLVQTLYQQVYAVRRGAITMLPLIKPNTILVIGRQESIDAAKELITKLDIPANPNAGFRIFPIKHAAAELLATQVQTSFLNIPRAGTGLDLSQQVNIIADFRTNSLIVQASPRDMVSIESMIRELDVPGSNIVTYVKAFRLKNALAANVATALQSTITASAGAQRIARLAVGSDGTLVPANVLYNVAIVQDVASNAVIVTAPADTMPLIAALIEQLDQLPTAESKIRVFSLANGNAFDLTTLLTNIFTTTTAAGAGQIATVRPGTEAGESTLVGVRFQADIRSNSIVAIGSEGDLAVAEALLLRLDSENLNNRTIFTMKLVNTPAEEIAPILNLYYTTERQFDIQNSAQFLPQSPLEQYRRETNIIAEPATNSLIISTTPQYYDILRKIIQDLDERPQMIAIDVLIAEVEVSKTKDRGVEFGLQDSILFNAARYGGVPGATAASTIAAGDANPLSQMTGTVPFMQTRTGSVGTQGITRLGTKNTGGFSFSASSESVSVFVQALETQSKTQILSRPRLVTLHNRRAQIQVGQTVPYASDVTYNTLGNPQVQTGWRDVGTILDITPRIMPDGMIAMAVYAERSSLGSPVTIATDVLVDTINTTNAQTTINAMDGETVVFAGLITEEKRSEHSSVPGLNKIPVIKHFFEREGKSSKRSELLIVMTPRIIRSPEDMQNMNQSEYSRIQWCARDVVKLTGNSEMYRRSDEWSPSEVRHHRAAPQLLNESQLPPENRIPTPVLPVIETR